MLKNGQKPNERADWGIESKEIWGTLNTLERHSKVESTPGDYRIFYQNMYNVLMGHAELLVKPEQARDVIKIIELAIQSNAEKEPWNIGKPTLGFYCR